MSVVDRSFLAQRRRLSLILYANAAQLILAVALSLSGDVVARHPIVAYTAAFTSIAPAILIVLLLIRHEWRAGAAIVALSIQSFALIVVFAAIYAGGGVRADPAGALWSDTLYFSIVTWTTLGYGDIHPSPSLRLIAGIEALYGYVFLGLIVGLIGAKFSR